QSTETLNYLKERGLKKETIEEFELGLAPNKFDDLSRYLTNSGYDIKDVERAGLIFKTERGSYVDRFRERIMFPLYNHFGKVVGFSGRVLPRLEAEKPELGKYINTPETLIFNKSRILYGFHKTKKHILEQKSAVLVEGQMDFLMAYQDGVKNVIATSGTALTFDHLKTIRRLAEQLILCFDNDEAGFNAVERAIDLANANDFNVKILTLQDFKDPAEAAQKSPGALAGLIKETKPAMEFYFERYLKEKVKLELPEFKKKIRIVLAKIKNLASAVERAQWLKELSQRTKIEEKTLAEEMEQLKTLNYAEKNAELRRNSPRQSASSLRESACSRRELICQRLISLAILDKDFQERINEHLDYFLEDYSLILKCLREEAKLEDERLNNLLNLISLRSSFESSILDPEKIEKEFQELLHQLRIEYLKEKRQGLTGLVKEAEGTGDETKVASVLKEFNEVSKSIQNA
ncbi:toprim domain-containing protein, partial [Candidatus Wolfebacteria bacterium]|nr:toprim domain-containing protein [Candidatus Wolfebacteria bacterium]